MNDIDALEVLGATKANTFDDITIIYKHLAKKFHADKYPGDKKAHDRFVDINVAYSYLKERYTKNELKLPLRSSSFLDMYSDIFPDLIDDQIFEEIIEYFIELGPKPLQPIFKHLKTNIDRKTILSLIINYGLEIPKKFVKAISKPKLKKEKKKKAKILSSKLYIHNLDYDLFKKADTTQRKSMALRCILETTRKCPYTGNLKTFNETVDLCFPKGLDPRGQISLGGRLLDIEITNLGFAPLENPSDLIIHTAPHAPVEKIVREGPAQTNIHTPVQKIDSLNLWKRGKPFSH
jgi:hypothetical protein